ncbi:MAG: ROK family protein [Streptosporangiales bacterium]|nr:ROK family protein [Streptosporangiales bacterium]
MAAVTPVVLALDVGGTKVLGGLVTPAGEVLRTREASTAAPGGADPGLRTTRDVARRLAGDASGVGEVVAVGAGFPEYVRAGELRSHEVLAWTGQPAGLLAAVVPGVPCVVESDVRCGAIGEAVLGAGAGLRSVLYAAWGTGLSSTVVLDGRPLTGERGEAIALGELGVSSVVDAGWEGNLERYASGQGVAERYSALTGDAVRGAVDVARRAAGGDACAAAVLESAGRAVGTALGWLVAVLDPAAVVLGGGLGTATTPAADAARQAYDDTVARRPHPPSLIPARLGSRAGLIGAALAAVVQTRG